MNLTKTVSVVFLLLFLIGCTTAPEKKSSNYWFDKASGHLNSGVEYYQNQRYKLAYHEFEQALVTFQRFNSISYIIDAHLNLANTSIALNHIDDALAQQSAAEYLIEVNGAEDKASYHALVKSTIQIELSQYDQARAILDKYLAAEKNTALKHGLLLNRVRLAFLMQENEQDWLGRLQTELGVNQVYQSRILYYQAKLAHSSADYASSDQYFNQALNINREASHSISVMTVLQDWGDALIERKQWRQASIRFEDLYTTSSSLKRKDVQKKALNGLIQSYQGTDDKQKYQWAQQQLNKLNGLEK